MNKLLLTLMFIPILALICNRTQASPPKSDLPLEPARFGAIGDGRSHPLGMAYGGTLASLADHVGSAGTRSFAWVMDPAYGLTFTRAISADQRRRGQKLHFASTGGPIGAAAQIIMPGMTASAACLPNGDTVRSVDRFVVVLAHPSSTACAAATLIAFTASDQQVQALEADWLGLEAAIAAAHALPGGGAVHIPRGTYFVDRPVLNPAGTADRHEVGHQVDEYGDGVAQTRIVYTRDLGPDACGFGEADRGIGSNTRTRIRDLRLMGPPAPAGGTASAMDGFCIGAKQLLRRVRADGFHAGANVLEDHWEIQDSEFSGNLYGIYLAPGGDTFGNGVLRDVFPVGNFMASIAISSSNTLDSATLQNIHLGFCPYGLYREAKPPGTTMIDGFISNSLLENVWGEAIGNGYILGENGVHDRVVRNVWINSSPVMDLSTNYRLRDRLPEAVIRVGAWVDNEMIGSDFGNPNNYRQVTRALIEAQDNIQGNAFGRAPDMISGSSAIKPALLAPVILFNTFKTGQAEGRFMTATEAVDAGEILAEGGFDRAVRAAPGRALAGVAMASAGTGGVVPVADRGMVRVNKVPGSLHRGDRLGSSQDDPTRAAVAAPETPAFSAAWQDAPMADIDVLAFLGPLMR